MTNDFDADKRLEELLSSMPNQHDTRSKDEVWAAIKQSAKPPIKKKKPWLPAVITVAALFVLVLFVQSLLSTLDSTSETTMTQEAKMSEGGMDEAGTEESSMSMSSVEESEESADSAVATGEAESASLQLAEDATLIFTNDPLLETYTPMNFSMNYQAIAFPITVLIPNERIEQDFEGRVPTQLELYKNYAAEIDEEALGFDNYHPLVGDYEEGESLRVTLPADHPYDMASATMEVYFNTLEDVFGSTFNQAVIVDENSQPIEWDQVGPLTEPVDLISENLAYNVMQNAIGETYLIPYTRAQYATVEEAIGQLQTPDNTLVEAVIPSSLEFTVEETEDAVSIQFAEMLTADALPRRDMVAMIESLVATAASFNKSLLLENWDTTLYPLPEDTNSLVGVNRVFLQSE